MMTENKEPSVAKVLHIKAFGQIAELLGESFEITAHISDVASLRSFLIEQNPLLKDMAFSIAVEHRMAGPDSKVVSGQEIALLPPFSGG